MSNARFQITTLTAEDWGLWRALRLQALAEAPSAFSSTLAEWQGDGDTEARWRDRLSSVPYNAIALLDGKPAGMVSATAPDARGGTTLISMWVAPFARGAGAGDALVRSVLAWAGAQCLARVELDVMAANARAIALYERHGFTIAGRSPDDACELRMVHNI